MQLNTIFSDLALFNTWVPSHACIRGRYYAQVTGPRIYVLNENPSFMALGAKTMCYFCGSSGFWKLGYHLSLWIFWKLGYNLSLSSESLIGFLAYLEPKLWITNQELHINSNPTTGNLDHFG